MSTAAVDFVITEHPPALTRGLERDYEVIRRRIEGLAGVRVRSRHYCDSGDFRATAVILSGSFAVVEECHLSEDSRPRGWPSTISRPADGG